MCTNDPQKVSRTDCTPWRDEDTLRHFYWGKGYSLLETAEAVGCTEGTVSQWCDRLGIETRDAQEARDTGTPAELEDESWLRREYLENDRRCADIADELDVTDLTVSNWLRRHDIPTRPANAPRNRATVECVNCGDEFEVIKSREHEAKYCSRECYYDAQDMPTGEDHWSWRDTPDKRPNSKAWHDLREIIRERDGYECQVCGITESKLGHELDVHHLERVRDADDPRYAENANPDLLVSLCRSCHRRVERLAPFLPSELD